jgi:uncharacterized protein
MKTRDLGYYAPEKLGRTRRVTPEGFLLCEGVPIARTGEQVCGSHELMDLEPSGSDQIIVSRPPEEVFSDRTVTSFEGEPVTINHPPRGVDPANWRSLAVGHLQNVRRGTGIEDDLLVADILVTEASAIEYVNKNLPDVSAGCDADYNQAQAGQATQRNITGNHLALLAGGRGRAGPRVAFRDSREPKSFWNGSGSPPQTVVQRSTFFDSANATANKIAQINQMNERFWPNRR